MSPRGVAGIAAANAATVKVVFVMVLWAACFPLITTGLTLLGRGRQRSRTGASADVVVDTLRPARRGGM